MWKHETCVHYTIATPEKEKVSPKPKLCESPTDGAHKLCREHFKYDFSKVGEQDLEIKDESKKQPDADSVRRALWPFGKAPMGDEEEEVLSTWKRREEDVKISGKTSVSTYCYWSEERPIDGGGTRTTRDFEFHNTELLCGFRLSEAKESSDVSTSLKFSFYVMKQNGKNTQLVYHQHRRRRKSQRIKSAPALKNDDVDEELGDFAYLDQHIIPKFAEAEGIPARKFGRCIRLMSQGLSKLPTIQTSPKRG